VRALAVANRAENRAMADLDLIHARGPEAVVAYRRAGPVRLADFLRDVGNLQAALPERRYVLNLCADRYDFTVLFCAAVLRGQVNLLPPTLTPHVIGQIRAGFHDAYCVTGDAPADHGMEVYRYQDLRGSGAGLQSVPVIPEDQAAAVIFTSGSSGAPTPNSKSWGSLARSATALVDSLGLRESGMALLGTVPPQHMFGIEATVFLPLQGFAVHSGRPFFPLDICLDLSALPRPRGLVTTPLHLQALLGGVSEFPALDFVLSSTAPLAQELAVEAETRLRAPVHEIYGCTEAGHVATRRTAQSLDWLLARGLAFRQDSRGTRVSGGHVESEVMLQDAIERLDGRRFRLAGRNADLVNIAGKRTSLAYLDHQLRSVEGVVDGAFVMPAERAGSVARLMAFAVAPGLSERSLMSLLRQRIDPAFLPRPLRLVESLPRNETGKLPRVALDELAARALESDLGRN
jgi:acyl-coenzyme A synthetase/AMP-(fatty) acid ligase